MEYVEKNGILYPNVEKREPLGKFGRMAKQHLKENFPIRYAELKMEDLLHDMLLKVDLEAKKQVKCMVEKAIERENPDRSNFEVIYKLRMTETAFAEEIVIRDYVLIRR